MTAWEFFAEMKKLTGYTPMWTIGRLRFIKNHHTFCPITAVCYEKTNQMLSIASVGEAAQLLGMDYFIAQQIAYAADCKIQCSREYRNMLEDIFNDLSVKYQTEHA